MKTFLSLDSPSQSSLTHLLDPTDIVKSPPSPPVRGRDRQINAPALLTRRPTYESHSSFPSMEATPRPVHQDGFCAFANEVPSPGPTPFVDHEAIVGQCIKKNMGNGVVVCFTFSDLIMRDT